jgi:hypothetical protein
MLGRHIERARPDGTSGHRAASDSVHTVVADVISILTNHKLGLPLDPAAVARLTADDPEVARSTTANPSEPGQEAEPTRADAADLPIAASYVLARSDLRILSSGMKWRKHWRTRKDSNLRPLPSEGSPFGPLVCFGRAV